MIAISQCYLALVFYLYYLALGMLALGMLASSTRENQQRSFLLRASHAGDDPHMIATVLLSEYRARVS